MKKGFVFLLLAGMLSLHAVTLVENGVPKCAIRFEETSLPDGTFAYPNKARTPRELAGFLRDSIEQVSGARVPCAPDAAGPVVIQLGGAKEKDLDEDEFIISCPDSRTVSIRAGNAPGLEWGVYEFVERFLGIRYLFPGPLGKHIPVLKHISVPAKEIREKPVFLHRHLTIPHNNDAEAEFLRFHRRHQRVRFHHAMGILVNPKNPYTSPEKFPWFYPVHNGKRMVPTSSSLLMGWQPCFSAKELPGVLAPRLARILNHSEHENFVSLGINDNGGFCECAECKSAPDGNYLRFCNALVSLVEKEVRRDFKIGFLGNYSRHGLPDDFQLNAHLVPFLTMETYSWLNPGKQKEGLQILRQWRRSSGSLGWYDYFYGPYYLLPRVYFKHHAETLRLLAENQVRYYYAELHGAGDSFQEGPKTYLAMKLLWNPARNPEAVLDDWYECAVGKKAAPCLRKYYEILEHFWTEEVPESSWFRENLKRTWMRFGDNRWMDAIRPAMMKELDSLLVKALENTETELQKERVKVLLARHRENKVVTDWYFSTKKLSEGKEEVRQTVKEDFSVRNPLGYWRHPSCRAVVRHDPSVGGGSVLIDKTPDADLADPGNAVLLKIVEVKPGQCFRVRVKVLQEKAAPEGKVCLTIRWREKDGKTWVNFMNLYREAEAVIPEKKWTLLTLSAVTPEVQRVGTMHISFGPARMVKGGRFWFDDLEISELR